MNRQFSQGKRRLWVIVNYSSMIVLASMVIAGEYSYWKLWISLGAVISFIILLTSYLHLYIRTNLAKMVQSKAESLDERELQILHRAHTRSYRALGLISIFFLFILFVTIRYSLSPITHSLTHRGHYSFGLVSIMVFNYLIHILPASLIAWSNEEILIKK